MNLRTIHNTLFRLAEITEGLHKSRHTAAIIYQDNLISLGTNRKKTDPFQIRFAKCESSIYLHAETRAIKLALNHLTPRQLKKSTLVVLRIKYNWKTNQYVMANSFPCIGCQRAVVEFGIKRVLYSTDDAVYQQAIVS